MLESPVINTSPLIFLTKANQLELLQQVVNKEVLVPIAVEAEIQQYGNEDITTNKSLWLTAQRDQKY